MLSKFLENVLSPISTPLIDEIRHTLHNRLLEYKADEYKRNLFVKTLLHRASPVELFKIYQPLKLEDLGAGLVLPEIENINELFKISRYVTILGDAGSGKSTLLKYLFLKASNEKSKFPIFIELRNLNNFEGTFHDYIKEEIFDFEKLAESDSVFDRLLSSDKFIFFLDGYDELNSKRKEQITRQINSFIKLFNNNNYIISSRPHTGIEVLPLFVNFKVCDLDQADIESFIDKQIPSKNKKIVPQIINAIKDTKNKDYQGYLKNPLLLSMFILTFQSYPKIPSQKSTFYKNVFDTLFTTHDSHTKLGFERERKCELSKEQFEIILRRFSLISFFAEVFTFSKKYLEDTFNSIKAHKKDIEFDNDDFIIDLQVSVGIIKKESLEYQFPHRSLQEFFAASHIAYSDESIKKKAYEKFTKMLLVKKQKLSELNNFYLLLQELDLNKATELLVIPLLKNLAKKPEQFVSFEQEINYYLRTDEIISLLDLKDEESQNLNFVNDKIQTTLNKIKKTEFEIEEGKAKIKEWRKELKELLVNEKQFSKEINHYAIEKNRIEGTIATVTNSIKTIDNRNLVLEKTRDNEILESKSLCKQYINVVSSLASKKIPELEKKLNEINMGEQELLELI